MTENKSKNQKYTLVIIGGLVGLLLLIFGGSLDIKKSADSDTDLKYSEHGSAEEYADMLETRIGEICSGVKGAGSVSVFVSLKGGYRTVYAYDAQSGNSGYKSEVVMSGSGSDKSAVVCAYENPEIAGVGIVCEGASDEIVKNRIISLVAASLNISANKIFVAVG